MKNAPLELIGLLALAKSHTAALTELEKEVRRVTGQKEEWGLCGDMVWGDIEHLSPEQAAKDLWENTAKDRGVERHLRMYGHLPELGCCEHDQP